MYADAWIEFNWSSVNGCSGSEFKGNLPSRKLPPTTSTSRSPTRQVVSAQVGAFGNHLFSGTTSHVSREAVRRQRFCAPTTCRPSSSRTILQQARLGLPLELLACLELLLGGFALLVGLELLLGSGSLELLLTKSGGLELLLATTGGFDEDFGGHTIWHVLIGGGWQTW